MRKFLLTALSIFILDIAFSQQRQASLIIKKTADWCPLCGTYGWTFFKKVKEDTKDLPSIMISMHHAGGLSNKTAQELNANFPSGGQPVFFSNGKDMFVTSQNVDAKVKEYVDSVKTRSAKRDIVKVDLKIIPKGNQFTAQIDLENDAALVNAQQSVSLFVLRDNVVHTQASLGASAIHTNVLSGALTPTTFGLPAYSGNIAAKTKLKINHDFPSQPLHNGKPEDVKIAAIIWNKVGDKFEFVNGVVVPMSQVTTSVENLSNHYYFIAYQKGSSLHIQKQKPGAISIYDLKGQMVFSDFYEHNEVNIDIQDLVRGAYLVQYKNNDVVSTTRIVIDK